VLVNRRYLDCKPTIITSNHLRIDDLRDSLGDRATSRLLEQCRVIPVDGPDLRAVK
jgi:DNA replication protein DnaC